VHGIRSARNCITGISDDVTDLARAGSASRLAGCEQLHALLPVKSIRNAMHLS